EAIDILGDTTPSRSFAGYDPIQNTEAMAPIKFNSTPLWSSCISDPELVGSVDCSDTLKGPWQDILDGHLIPEYAGAYDYAEVRITVTVPENVSSLSFNVAFFSSEYPAFYQTDF